MRPELTLVPLQREIFWMLGWSLKALIVSGRLVVVGMILCLRLKAFVISINCLLKPQIVICRQKPCILFSEIIVLL